MKKKVLKKEEPCTLSLPPKNGIAVVCSLKWKAGTKVELQATLDNEHWFTIATFNSPNYYSFPPGIVAVRAKLAPGISQKEDVLLQTNSDENEPPTKSQERPKQSVASGVQSRPASSTNNPGSYNGPLR